MTTEYVYLIFFQRTDKPLSEQKVPSPLEYRSKCIIENIRQFADIQKWIVRKLSTDKFIITGLTYLREEKF